jgi:hypothetical protein
MTFTAARIGSKARIPSRSMNSIGPAPPHWGAIVGKGSAQRR